MGDNGEIKKDEGQPIVQMTITFNPNNGSVQVIGPITNRTLSYGMLEMAKEAIYDLKQNQRAQIVSVKPHGIMDFVRKN